MCAYIKINNLLDILSYHNFKYVYDHISLPSLLNVMPFVQGKMINYDG